MYRESVLKRICVLHGALVVAAVFVSVALGFPARGIAMGGGAMAASLLLIWGMVRLTMAGRKGWLVTLASLKVLLYLSLLAAIFTGWFVADGAGFAIGVTCFLVSTVLVVALSSRRQRLA
jgi:hypothetical protein